MILLLIQHLFHPHHISFANVAEAQKHFWVQNVLDCPEYMLKQIVFSFWKSLQDTFQQQHELSVDIYQAEKDIQCNVVPILLNKYIYKLHYFSSNLI